MNTESEFWAAVDKSGDCWNWVGARGVPTRSKYGHVVWHEKQHLTHRVAWMISHGPIPPGMDVCHHCDNPHCVRPDHLFLGTRAENMADCARKGRRKGEKNPMARLSDQQVGEIRLLSTQGMSFASIARQFHVSGNHVGRIVRGTARA